MAEAIAQNVRDENAQIRIVVAEIGLHALNAVPPYLTQDVHGHIAHRRFVTAQQGQQFHDGLSAADFAQAVFRGFLHADIFAFDPFTEQGHGLFQAHVARAERRAAHDIVVTGLKGFKNLRRAVL